MSINKEIENINSDLSELSSLVSVAKSENIKKLLTTEANKLSQRKEYLLKQISVETGSQSQQNPTKSNAKTGEQQAIGSVVVNTYMWDQTSDFVKIYIDIDKNYELNSSDIKLNFPNNRSFSLIFGKYKFSLAKLNADIETDKSYFKLTKSPKIIVYLKKVDSKQWPNINEVESKYKKALDEEKSLGDDPSAGLMKIMKQMYDEGDDEMKRTIAKSWYESRNKNLGDNSFDPLG